MAERRLEFNTEVPPTVQRPMWRIGISVLRFFRKNPNIAYGTAVIGVMMLLTVLAPVMNTVPPNTISPWERFQAPSSSSWFGTDHLGRDVYSRTIYGTRISILVGLACGLISIIAGAVIGLIAGYYRRLDGILMRLMDGLMAIPTILLAMAMMALLGGSVQNVIIAISVTQTPIAARVLRSAVMSVREQTYVDAARALGASTVRILGLHVLPNTVAPLIVQATFIAAAAVLIEAYLSFLGAGTPIDQTSWGQIMAEAQLYLSRAEWVMVFPGVFLTLTVLGISLAGDGLRDTLDPRLKRKL